jgi:hypothetical protein
LIHWCWNLNKRKVKASKIPPLNGVFIEWDHGDEENSIKAANEMVLAFGIHKLQTKPALRSRHTERKAIDMTITWSGTLVIKDAAGLIIPINTEPRTGMNKQLHDIGKTYRVIKYWDGPKDKPHWSIDGR